MIKRPADVLFETLNDQCASIARRLSPAHADEWLDAAQAFIGNTAEAIRMISAFSMSPVAEPAFQFAVDPSDASHKDDIVSDNPDPDLNHSRMEQPHLSESHLRGPNLSGPDLRGPHLRGPNLSGPDLRGPALSRSTIQNQSSLTVLQAAHAIRQGDLSPVELVKSYLDRIETTEGIVSAWDTITAENAIAQAKHAEQALINGQDLGPLHGIPFGIKDNIFTKGVRTSGGSRLYESFIPSYDANVVTLLKQAGAIVLGKTTTAEMALGDPPSTRNPWNLNHTPGGSSTGSAAAVAAGHVPFTLGTQTGGSLNRPAGYTGLVALKPTYGSIDRHGIFPVSWTMDHVGVMTKTAADQAVIFHALACLSKGESALSLVTSKTRTTTTSKATTQYLSVEIDHVRSLTVGRPDRYFFETLHPAQRSAFEELLRVLEKDLDMTIKEIVLPPAFEAAIAAHTIMMQCEAAASNAISFRQQSHLIGPALRSRLLCGHATGAPDYIRAQQIRNMYIQQLASLFRDEDIDVLATPTSPTPAPRGIHWTGSSMFNSPFSITGFPTIVFPVGFEEKTGLPLSAQFVTPPLQEGTLLKLAMAYQTVTDWHTRHPLGH